MATQLRNVARIDPRSADDYADSSAEKRKVMVVGAGINITGEMRSCDQLVVHGTVEGSLTDCRMLTIANAGSFKGTAEADAAEIDGNFRGRMVVRGRLLIRATGKVNGEISYGEVEIERGGEVSGTVVRMEAGA